MAPSSELELHVGNVRSAMDLLNRRMDEMDSDLRWIRDYLVSTAWTPIQGEQAEQVTTGFVTPSDGFVVTPEIILEQPVKQTTPDTADRLEPELDLQVSVVLGKQHLTPPILLVSRTIDDIDEFLCISLREVIEEKHNSGFSKADGGAKMSLIQAGLFCNLMQLGMTMSPLILSTNCSIVLNLYRSLHTELKVQIEALFSCVLLRIVQSKPGSSYKQQEVAMEVLVEPWRQHTFIAEGVGEFNHVLKLEDEQERKEVYKFISFNGNRVWEPGGVSIEKDKLTWLETYPCEFKEQYSLAIDQSFEIQEPYDIQMVGDSMFLMFGVRASNKWPRRVVGLLELQVVNFVASAVPLMPWNLLILRLEDKMVSSGASNDMDIYSRVVDVQLVEKWADTGWKKDLSGWFSFTDFGLNITRHLSAWWDPVCDAFEWNMMATKVAQSYARSMGFYGEQVKDALMIFLEHMSFMSGAMTSLAYVFGMSRHLSDSGLEKVYDIMGYIYHMSLFHGKKARRANAIIHKVITGAIQKTVGGKFIELVTSSEEIPELLKLNILVKSVTDSTRLEKLLSYLDHMGKRAVTSAKLSYVTRFLIYEVFPFMRPPEQQQNGVWNIWIGYRIFTLRTRWFFEGGVLIDHG